MHKTPVETEEEKGGCAKLDNGIVGEGESSSHYRHNRTFHLNMALFTVCPFKSVITGSEALDLLPLFIQYLRK